VFDIVGNFLIYHPLRFRQKRPSSEGLFISKFGNYHYSVPNIQLEIIVDVWYKHLHLGP
jgi:hypothetical protein